MVCAIGPCAIRENHSREGVGGLFIGNYEKNPTNPIALALKNPEMIEDNTIENTEGERLSREETNKGTPVDLLVSWRGAIRNDGMQPPRGKRVLR